MVLIEVPTFVRSRDWYLVAIAIAISLVIAASSFMFAFFLRDFIFEILRRNKIYDVNNPSEYSDNRMIAVHLILFLIIIIYVVALYLFMRWLFVGKKYKK